MTRLISFLIAIALVAAACSSSDAETTTTTAAPTTSTTTTTTPTTSSTTTTEPPPTTVTVRGDAPRPIREHVESVYNYAIDTANPEPNGLKPGLAEILEEMEVEPGRVRADATVSVLENGDRVAVAEVGKDSLVLLNTGDGWRTVAAMFKGADPWVSGGAQRSLLVLGSDAREGEDQLNLRADSIHILSLIPEEGEGAILGFPRDSWVLGSKLTDLMPGRGPEGMQTILQDLTGLEFEGWVAVGFEGFLGLMEELGPLEIDLPTEMRSGNSWEDYPAGPQELDPSLALRLGRIRKGLPAGDLDRSYNQGLIMLAAMKMVKDMGIERLPTWVKAWDSNGFTDLDNEDLVTWLAGAYMTSPKRIVNTIVPASVGTVGAASVVFISDSAEQVYRDLDDGLLEPTDG